MSPELVSILAQIMAQQGYILSMQADNMQRAAIGASMAWTSADFSGPTMELERLAAAARLAS